MMRSYYTLVSSLPYLPHFDQASRLPINPDRLDRRLRMLHPEDARNVERAQRFVAWHYVAYRETDEEIVDIATRYTGYAALDRIIAFRADLRTIMAALRRRRMGRPAPEPSERWGAGPHVAHLVRNWDDPDFRLLHVYPWIAAVRGMLEEGNALGLEKALLDATWRDLERLAQGREFGLEAVLVYLFKWDIIRRWLSYSREGARANLERQVAAFHDEISSRDWSVRPWYEQN